MSENINSGVGLAIGTTIGKYEVVARVGIGGQAIVYKAYDQMLDRHVAIKQISTHLAENQEFLDRFRKEAQILARLANSQPSLVTIHELIQEEKGLFIVMEFVPGHTLETTLSNNPGPIEPKAVLQILWRLAAGMHSVHSAGILHRDIKPGNILIGEGLKVKITDFGVAASSGQTSMVLGTTKYMAPELYGSKNVDARVDMYSLGFVAYEMLLGRAKFNEVFSDLVRDKHSEALRWMKWHGSASVQAPALHDLNPAVPQALSDIVARMMAKDPEKRFDNMESLGRAIKASFSPRAQAVRDAESTRLKRTLSESGMAAALEGDDELEVAAGSSEPPATAVIPKARMTLRTKLIFAGAAAVLLLATGVFWMVHQQNKKSSYLTRVGDLYAEAEADYKSGKFSQAASGYEAIFASHKGTAESAKSSVQLHLAKAKQALQDAVNSQGAQRLEQWDIAASQGEAAKKQLEKVQSLKSELYGWTQDMGREIEEFSIARISTRGFCGAMEKSLSNLEVQKFDQARKVLDSELSNPQIRLSASQEDELRLHRQRIETDEFQLIFSHHMKAAQEAILGKKFELAAEEFSQATKMLRTDTAGLLQEPLRKQFTEQLESGRSKLLVLNSYWSEMMRADQAQQANKKALALASLEKAHQIKPTPDVDDRIKTLKAELAFDEAKSLSEQGRYDLAKEALERSLKFKDLPQAKAELARITRSQELAVVAAAADKAFKASDFTAASQNYQKAIELDPGNTEFQDGLKKSQYNLKRQQAFSLASQKKYDEASVILDECRKLLPERAAEVESIWQGMRQNRDYELALGRGNENLQSKHWLKAREVYAAAQKIKDTKEVRDLIKQAHYGENLEKGQSALEQGFFADAKGYFNVASRYLDTPEIRKLISLAEQKQKEQAP